MQNSERKIMTPEERAEFKNNINNIKDINYAEQSNTNSQEFVNNLINDIPDSLPKIAYLYARSYFGDELNNVLVLFNLKQSLHSGIFEKFLLEELKNLNTDLYMIDVGKIEEKILIEENTSYELKKSLNDKISSDSLIIEIDNRIKQIDESIKELSNILSNNKFINSNSQEIDKLIKQNKDELKKLEIQLTKDSKSKDSKNSTKTFASITKTNDDIRSLEDVKSLRKLSLTLDEVNKERLEITNNILSSSESHQIESNHNEQKNKIVILKKELKQLMGNSVNNVNTKSSGNQHLIVSNINDNDLIKHSIAYLTSNYDKNGFINKQRLDEVSDFISVTKNSELRQYFVEELRINNLITVMLDKFSLEEKQSLIHQMSNEQQASYKPLLTLIKSTILRINGNSRENFNHKVKKFSSVITESTDLSKLVDDAKEILLNPIDKLALTVTLIRKKYKDLTSDELKEYIEKLNGNNINAKREIANALIQTLNHMKLAKIYYEEIGEYNDFITKLSDLVISDISNNSYDLQTFSKIFDNFKDDSTVINDILKQVINRNNNYDAIIGLIENAADVKDIKSKINMADKLNELYKKISQDKFYNERKEIRRELLEKINDIYVNKLAEKKGDNQLGVILEKCSGTNIYNSLRIAVDKISKNSNQNDVLGFKDILSDEIIGNTILCAPNLPTYDKSKIALERVIDSKNTSLSTLDKLREFFRPVLSILGSTPDPQILMSAAAYVIGAKMKHSLTNGEDKTKLNNIKDEIQIINGKTFKGRNT